MVLHDAPIAAELLEEVASEVSVRLHAEPAVGRNLKGYLITAFHHRVRLEFVKNSRLAYEGLLRELEGKHPLLASDWAAALEVKMFVDHLTALMPGEAQRIVHYRLLAFSWEEIGDVLGIPVTQARNKYYYGVKTAYERLLANVAKQREEEELI
jgi:DNA-directed RNA polymerase specialized sigma24 family protein